MCTLQPRVRYYRYLQMPHPVLLVALRAATLLAEVVSEIEVELDRMRDIMAAVPDPPGLGRGGAGAGAAGGWGGARGDGRPGPDQADEKACCFCFTMRRRR